MMMPAQLTSLPYELLCAIMKRTDQAGRVSSMLATKALSAAALGTGVWDSVTFRELDRTAVEFMARHRCSRVTVDDCPPDDVAWFMHMLADTGCAECITDLAINIGTVQRVPADLLCAVSRHTGLETLEIIINDCDLTCEISFPVDCQLHQLRRLSIVEIESNQIIVWFQGCHARFTSLSSLCLDVSLSDVMTGLRHMPHLRTLTYRCDPDDGGETFEDVRMTGTKLDRLEIDVGNDTDMGHLAREMELASIDTLVLHMNDDYLDLTHPFSPSLRRLVLSMYTQDADVELDFPNLVDSQVRDITVVVGAPWILLDSTMMEACHFDLSFRHTPNLTTWMEHLRAGRLTLNTTESTRVIVNPR